MSAYKSWIAAFALIVAMLAATGCQVSGQVEQGRVIAYDKKTGVVTLIPEASTADLPGVLPPLAVKLPEDPEEMGPAPSAGKLIRLEAGKRRLVVFDAAEQVFRTIPYTPLEERRKLAKSPSAPPVDRVKKTITVYSPEQRLAVTFAASDDLLAMPADTWKSGDVIRYYYQQPGQALRLMNVTKTDLSKSGS